MLLGIFLASYNLLAHQGSTSYLSFDVEEDRLAGRWEIPLADLDLALGLDADGDHKVSLDELRGRLGEARKYVFERLKLKVDGAEKLIIPSAAEVTIREFADGANTALDFSVTNLVSPKILEVDYRFMFDLKPLDRGFIQVRCRGVVQTAVFTAEQPTQRFNLEVPSHAAQFLSFLRHGVWHIWIGFDHILFLLALLLPSVLHFEGGVWRAATGFREAFLNVFKVVTAFTLAHSVTLTLAALQIVKLPSRWVESAIAASVLLAAVNNIRVLVRGRVWLVAFAFGLIHGFGFANVLSELGLPRQALILALVGFNVGVEAGQLAIVAVFLPIAYGLRHSRFYQHGILKFGSACIALLAGLWLVERLFDTKILPF